VSEVISTKRVTNTSRAGWALDFERLAGARIRACFSITLRSEELPLFTLYAKGVMRSDVVVYTAVLLCGCCGVAYGATKVDKTGAPGLVVESEKMVVDDATLFNAVDQDRDGVISEQEMVGFVLEQGKEDPYLDDKSEVDLAVQSSFRSLDRNGDHTITKAELGGFLDKLAQVLPVEETVAWVTHAMQLPPDVVAKFGDMGVIGEDFSELLLNDGELLSTRMGINKLVKKRVVRGMKLKMMGVADSPPPADSLAAAPKGCGKLMVQWALPRPSEMVFPVHRAVLQRHSSTHAIHGLALDSAWTTVYTGLEEVRTQS
jgi:hypothetical protein